MGILDLLIDGVSVRNICLEYNIPEKKIEEGFKRQRSIKRLDKYSDEELVRVLLKNLLKGKINDYKRKYIINGLTVLEYSCKYHLIPQSLRDHIKRGLEVNPSADINELAWEFVLSTRRKENNDVILRTLCRNRHVSIKEVYKIYFDEYANREDISKEEAYNSIISYLHEKNLAKRRKLENRKVALI